ncbi:hypothetical protein BCU66_013450 [Vibrio sp. 10N.286.49.B1]|nr:MULTISPECIES: hypothetical protein [unclassified Vibrio]
MADGNRGRGVESQVEIQYTGLCLEWVSEYLLKAKEQFDDKFEN